MAPTGKVCYDNTLAIANKQRARKDLSTPFVVEICRNSNLRVLDSTRDAPYAGTNPPLIAQPNLHVKCGEEGNVKDECIIYDGDTMLLNVWEMDLVLQSKNVVFEGLTFERARGSFMELLNGGDITFRNCLFRVSVYLGKRQNGSNQSRSFKSHIYFDFGLGLDLSREDAHCH